MYPVNTPNQYNQPKAKENPLQLKHGSYFWLSRVLGTYTKERYAKMQLALEEIKQRSENQATNEEISSETL